MAEILIKAMDAINSDPVKNLAGCYKKGDIVVIMPDNWTWGKEETLPKFVILKIPGVVIDEKYILPRYSGIDPISENPICIKRRDYTLLESLVDQAIANGGTLTISQIMLANSIRKL